MNMPPLEMCIERHRRQAALVLQLDDQLGGWHGLSWADFVLLDALDAAGGLAPTADLARTLSMPGSRLLLQLLPLEKVGLLARRRGADGLRQLALSSNGQRQCREARETAARVCEKMLET